MRIAGRIAALVALWLLAWGQLSVASVASGVAVASALLIFFPPGPPANLRFHLLGTVRLVGHIAVQLVTSNLVMARELVRREPALAPGVVAHRLRRPSPEVVTVMTSVIALSPGTMTVDTAPDDSAIYVHVLFLDDVEAMRSALAHLERLVVGAIGPEPLRDGALPVPKEIP
jgi:multisubunit Na+/H+ antiporter MnhE subunit